MPAVFKTSNTIYQALSLLRAAFQSATPFQATAQITSSITNNDCENVNASIKKIYHENNK